MSARSCLFVMLMGLPLPTQGATAPTTPTPPSASAAQASPVDLSEPRAAIRSIYQALRVGDIKTAADCMVFQDARQAEAFQLAATQVWGPFRLMHAMEARFGDAARKPFANAGQEKHVDDLLAKLQTVSIQVEGDTAVVADKKAAVNPSADNELNGITLRKVGSGGSGGGGQWKVVGGTFLDFASDLPPRQVRLMRPLHDAIVTACDATLAKLARGDFKTADEAYADYQSRLKSATALAGHEAAKSR